MLVLTIELLLTYRTSDAFYDALFVYLSGLMLLLW